MFFSSAKKFFWSSQFFALSVLLVFLLLPMTLGIALPGEYWVKQTVNFFLWTGMFYINIYVLVPKMLYRGRSALFGTTIILSLIMLFILNRLIDGLFNIPFLINKLMKVYNPSFNYEQDPTIKFSFILITLFVLGVSTIIAVSQKAQLDQITRQNLEKEKIGSELAFLKTQINPHFFFNILHTIYALTDTNVQMARESLYTLSQMMRYVLYETKNDLTTLEKEIIFVENYIKLMKLRMTERVEIVFEKPERFKNFNVAPMLFLPFIENAFKHGISNVHPSYIYIGIIELGNTLSIEVNNSTFINKTKNLEESNGIGLVNTRRRLDLIYPKKYELLVGCNEVKKEFNVRLKLQLQ